MATGLVAFVSADGLRWKKLRDEPVLTKSMVPFPYMFDSQNLAFWSPSEGKYVSFFRVFEGKIRRICRAESDDFVNWKAIQLMEYQNLDGSSAPLSISTRTRRTLLPRSASLCRDGRPLHARSPGFDGRGGEGDRREPELFQGHLRRDLHDEPGRQRVRPHVFGRIHSPRDRRAELGLTDELSGVEHRADWSDRDVGVRESGLCPAFSPPPSLQPPARRLRVGSGPYEGERW